MPFPYTFPFIFDDHRKAVGNGTVTPGGPASATFPYTFPFNFTFASSLKVKIVGRLVGSAIMTPASVLGFPRTRPLNVGNAELTPSSVLGLPATYARAVGQAILTPLGMSFRNMFLLVGGASLSPSSDLNKQTSKSVGLATLTPASIDPVAVRFYQSVVGSGVLTPASAILRKISKFPGSAVLTPSSDVNKMTSVRMGQGSVSSSSTISMSITVGRLVGNAVLTPAGNLLRMTSRTMGQATLTPGGFLSRGTSKILTGAVVSSGSTLLKTSKIIGLGGTVSPTGAWSRAIQVQAQVGQGVVTSSGGFFKTWLKDVGGAVLTPSGGASYTGILARLTSTIRSWLGITTSQQAGLSLSHTQTSAFKITSTQSRR